VSPVSMHINSPEGARCLSQQFMMSERF